MPTLSDFWLSISVLRIGSVVDPNTLNLDPEPDPECGPIWIRIRIQVRSRIQGYFINFERTNLKTLEKTI